MRPFTALALLALGCGDKDEPPGVPDDQRILEGPLTGLRVEASPDLTGDGLPDVLVSAPGLDGSGAVHVFSGPLTGALGVDAAVATFAAAAPGDVGEGLAACGDTDGDGAPDLLVGAPHADADRGGAWLVSGPLVGALSPADARFVASVPYERAGFTVACGGDTDGDGLADLALTAPDADGFGAATGTGHVSFLRGTTDGPDAVGSLSSTHSDSHLGTERSLVFADLDGDGLDDAAVGAPGADRVHLLFGPLKGTYDPNVSGGTWTGDADDGTGTALAVGDLDGDGHRDLVAGAPDHKGRTGHVGVLTGPFANADGPIRGQARWIEGQDIGERFGFSLAVADLDADGLDDLVVGAPGAVTIGPEGGAVYVMYGPVPQSAAWDADAVLIGDVAWGAFGWSVAAVPDLDGDGGAELLVGAPHTDVDHRVGAGAAYLFDGALSGQVGSSAATASVVF